VRTLATILAVCAARDLGRDTAEIPGQHLVQSSEDSDRRLPTR
jgi:hypothetical protein